MILTMIARCAMGLNVQPNAIRWCLLLAFIFSYFDLFAYILNQAKIIFKKLINPYF